MNIVIDALLTEKKTNRNDISVILDHQQADLTHIHDEDTIRTMEKMKNIDIEYSNKHIEPPEELKMEDSNGSNDLDHIEDYHYLQTEQESTYMFSVYPMLIWLYI